MRQRRDFYVPKGRDALPIHGLPVRLQGLPISLLRVLQRLSGTLLAGLAVLLFMRLRGAPMSVGGIIVQLSGSLVILVVRSIVVTSRHL
jgi:hypothetical protein